MKVAFSVDTDNGLQSLLSARFGRAAGLLVVDTDSGEALYVNNSENVQAAQGAGIQASQQLVELGVKAVVTGRTGPKAQQVLDANNIQTYRCDPKPVDQALNAFKQGELSLQAQG